MYGIANQTKKLNCEYAIEKEKKEELNNKSLVNFDERIANISSNISKKMIDHNENATLISDVKEQIKQNEVTIKYKHAYVQKRESRLKIMNDKLSANIEQLEILTKKKLGLNVSDIVGSDIDT